jgi:hypothetical protein
MTCGYPCRHWGLRPLPRPRKRAASPSSCRRGRRSGSSAPPTQPARRRKFQSGVPGVTRPMRESPISGATSAAYAGAHRAQFGRHRALVLFGDLCDVGPQWCDEIARGDGEQTYQFVAEQSSLRASLHKHLPFALVSLYILLKIATEPLSFASFYANVQKSTVSTSLICS